MNNRRNWKHSVLQIKRYQQRLKSLQSQMHRKRSQLMDVITNMTPVKYDIEKIMQTFIWTALLLLMHSVVATFSTYFFSIFIKLIIR